MKSLGTLFTEWTLTQSLRLNQIRARHGPDTSGMFVLLAEAGFPGERLEEELDTVLARAAREVDETNITSALLGMFLFGAYIGRLQAAEEGGLMNVLEQFRLFTQVVEASEDDGDLAFDVRIAAGLGLDAFAYDELNAVIRSLARLTPARRPRQVAEMLLSAALFGLWLGRIVHEPTASGPPRPATQVSRVQDAGPPGRDRPVRRALRARAIQAAVSREPELSVWLAELMYEAEDDTYRQHHAAAGTGTFAGPAWRDLQTWERDIRLQVAEEVLSVWRAAGALE